jgi:hypothetical protein
LRELPGGAHLLQNLQHVRRKFRRLEQPLSGPLAERQTRFLRLRFQQRFFVFREIAPQICG